MINNNQKYNTFITIGSIALIAFALFSILKTDETVDLSNVDKLLGSSIPSTPTVKTPTKLEDNRLCKRDVKYTLEPEFERAMSLLMQRLEESELSQTQDIYNQYNSIFNCVNISYATSESAINGSEGYFVFDSNSTNDKLDIVVSPKYHSKDDLLTSILLTHELAHAYFFASGKSNNLSCLDNEAYAHSYEFYYLGTINQEEVASITYRYNNHYSPEAEGPVNLLTGLHDILNRGYKGIDLFREYVSRQPAYQVLCDLNN